MQTERKYTHLLLDLGGVILQYQTSLNPAPKHLSQRTIKLVIDSPIWHDFERNRISQEECHQLIQSNFGIDPETWIETERALTVLVQPDMQVVAAVKKIFTDFPHLKLYAFSNMTQPTYGSLLGILQNLGIDFIDIITSAALEERKPDLSAYYKILDIIQASPESCIFVDDTIENVSRAETVGIQAILYQNVLQFSTDLHNMLGDSAERAMHYLKDNAKNLWCTTNEGAILRDNFSQLLILQATKDRDLVSFEHEEGYLWKYFIGSPIMTDKVFPKDADTTSLAYVTLDMPLPGMNANKALDEISANTSSDGFPLTYFDKNRPRVCPFVAANCLRFFYLYGQGYRMKATEAYLCRVLDTRSYETGSRYYFHPDWMLYYLGDLCGRCDHSDLSSLREKVKAQLLRRKGSDKDPFPAAMRLLATQALSIDNEEDLLTILKSQQLDGGWEQAWLFKYGNIDTTIGSRAVVTAMAYKAIRAARGTHINEKTPFI